MVSLRFINTSNSKIIGSFELNPRSSTSLDPASPPVQGPASNQRHGDAAPALRSDRAVAFRAPGGLAVTKSDLALMFGAGVLAVGGPLQKASTRLQHPSFWLHPPPSRAIRRRRAPR